jgi:hypothetical protein
VNAKLYPQKKNAPGASAPEASSGQQIGIRTGT